VRRTAAAHRGSHQFHWPNSDTRAGTSSERTTVASSRMPAPTPVAKIFRNVNGALASAAMARNRINAAEVTSRPVRPMPVITAWLVEPVRSYSSRIRVSRKTS
jgi:hypothetical protein